MRFPNKLFMAVKSLTHHKSLWFKNLVLAVVSLTIFTIVFTLTSRFQDIYKMNGNNNIYYRSINVMMKASDEGYFKTYFEELSEDERIIDVVQNSYFLTFYLDNPIDYASRQKNQKKAFYGTSILSDQYTVDESFLISGSWIDVKQANQVVIPKYFSIYSEAIDLIDNGFTYLDGEEFLGRTITGKLYSFVEEEGKLVRDQEYACKFSVVGVYDNVYSQRGSTQFLISNIHMADYYSKVVESSDTNTKNYKVVVKDFKDVEKVMQKISNDNKGKEIYLSLLAKPGYGQELTQAFKVIGISFSCILLFLSLIILIIQGAKMFDVRRSEYGLLFGLGFSKSLLKHIVLMEIFLISLITFFTTLILSQLGLVALEVIIKSNLSIHYNYVKLPLDIRIILTLLILSFLIPILPASNTIRYIRNENLLVEINKGNSR